MMKYLFIVLTAALLVSGCASGGHELKVQELQNRVTTLESQLQNREQQIDELENMVNDEIRARKELERKVKPGKSLSSKERPTTKQIQQSLKNAGYDPGEIDGKMGEKTITAIKAFQKANGLKADAVVGANTWDKLSTYLNE